MKPYLETSRKRAAVVPTTVGAKSGALVANFALESDQGRE
jgi:hypothetical protein